MISIKAVIKSMRLRTLPLSLSGVIMGSGLAVCKGNVPDAPTVIFLFLTTVLLQILSNLSNELGDTLHGTDSAAARQGMHYSLMDGEMSMGQMKGLTVSAVIACTVSGLLMIYFCCGTLFSIEAAVFIALGACAITAAMRYTLGRNPYGYRGLGDIFVFIFFGLVSTCGAYYICSHDLMLHTVLLPACAIGLLSTAVLNVNNMRDMKTDAATRVTTAIRLGEKGAAIYQTALISVAWALLVIFRGLWGPTGSCTWTEWLFLATVPLFAVHLKGVRSRRGKALDSMLPLLVTGTFLLSILFVIPAIHSI